MRKNGAVWIYPILFVLVLILPLVLINRQPNQVSDLDNRKLTEWPGFTWSAQDTYVSTINSYFNDRVGLRSQLITAQQVYNDMLYDVLTHPNYEYGQDKSVFFRFAREPQRKEYAEFIDIYTDFVANVQNYCDERGTLFYYILNPGKDIMYPEKVASGITYKYQKYNDILSLLQEKQINYMDLAQPMRKAKNELGLLVNNVKFDAGHWSQHGAFYSMMAMIDWMRTDTPSLHPMREEDYFLTFSHETELLLSHFPIDEKVPHYTPIAEPQAHLSILSNIKTSPNYPTANYYANSENPSGPRLLVFHGSNMSEETRRMYVDQFSEALFITSYNAIQNFYYYYSLFEPDIVLYEVADRTIVEAYVGIRSVETAWLPPNGLSFSALPETDVYTVAHLTSEKKDNTDETADAAFPLSTLHCRAWGDDLQYAYLQLDNRYLDCAITREEMWYDITITIRPSTLESTSVVALVLVSENKNTIQTIPLSIANFY